MFRFRRLAYFLNKESTANKDDIRRFDCKIQSRCNELRVIHTASTEIYNLRSYDASLSIDTKEASSSFRNIHHDIVNRLRHTVSFRNYSTINRHHNGYALNVFNIDVQIVPESAIVNRNSHIAACNVRDEGIIVCIKNDAAFKYAGLIAAERLIFDIKDGDYTFRKTNYPTLIGDVAEMQAARDKRLIKSYREEYSNDESTWDYVNRIVSLAVVMLEMRRQCVTMRNSKVFIIPINNANQLDVMLLTTILALLSPTYFTQTLANGGKGDNPTITIHDALAATRGAFCALDSLRTRPCGEKDKITGVDNLYTHQCFNIEDYIEPLQAILCSFANRNHGAWNLQPDTYAPLASVSSCHCSLPDAYMAQESCFWHIDAGSLEATTSDGHFTSTPMSSRPQTPCSPALSVVTTSNDMEDEQNTQMHQSTDNLVLQQHFTIPTSAHQTPSMTPLALTPVASSSSSFASSLYPSAFTRAISNRSISTTPTPMQMIGAMQPSSIAPPSSLFRHASIPSSPPPLPPSRHRTDKRARDEMTDEELRADEIFRSIKPRVFWELMRQVITIDSTISDQQRKASQMRAMMENIAVELELVTDDQLESHRRGSERLDGSEGSEEQ